jgi:hypothetical protein
MYYLSTCFQVRAYWLFNDEDTTARREGVVKAFASASRYIEHLNSGDKSSLPVRYLRFLDLRICFTAAIFLSKVIHSSYRNFVDEEHGKKVFSTAISFFKNSTVEDNDMNGRSTKVLAQLWSIHKNLFDQSPQSPPRISLKSRLLFSIAHDGLWQWREKYAGQPSNGAPDLPPPLISPAETSTLEEPNSLDERGASLSESVPQPTAVDQSAIGIESSNGPSLRPSSGLSKNDLMSNESELLQHPGVEIGQQTSLNGADAMHFDLLFPDFDMGYATQSWP